MRIERHAFQAADLVGGNLALDLANTVTARDSQPRDWLDDYDALLRWARQSGHYPRADLAALESLALAQPAKAAAALTRAKTLREALCELLYALAQERTPPAAALAVLDRARLAASAAARLAARQGRLHAEWAPQRSGLDLIAHVVTAHAIDLLKDAQLDRLRICDGHDCGWVFIDTSKNGRRRWCDMATCGNVAKARRHQQRSAH
ncbi:CGNR zinc finger domain-containing protein [Lysobacter silvisoli]|uniref:Zinc finger CGNR domain-containing protein n=1 Tax=Lysobacter silvisoli TaxID=2293254 RepID=A0A371JXP4_9GAMM|nr:CGNR zinc finger domain-containing protein [Lysobacter silvisoli]RDZ26433.1 hypothetical protein DX914_15645 [Lysobacter silvisoli]